MIIIKWVSFLFTIMLTPPSIKTEKVKKKESVSFFTQAMHYWYNQIKGKNQDMKVTSKAQTLLL